MRRWTASVVGAALLAGAAVPAARAQSMIDFSGQPTMTFGAIGLTPTIALNGFGVDTNVFNEADDAKQDLTATLAPAVDTSVHAGRFNARLHSGADLIYFRQYTNQRAANTSQDLVAGMRMHKLTPFVTAQYINARERPNIEIDTRVRRRYHSIGGGIQAEIGPRFTLRLDGQQQTTRFEEGEVFEGLSLSEQLNERAVSVTGTMQYALTPLTRINVGVQRQHDRFTYSPLRDASSVRVSTGVEFARTALISGRASVGVRVFDAADTRVQDFTGLVASIDLGYTYRGTTQFTIRADRDVAYSFTPTAPYYLLTSLAGSVTHRLTPAWDVTATAGRQHLGYQQVNAGGFAPGEVDTTRLLGGTGWAFVYGAGAGRRIGSSRVGVTVDYSARPAGVSGRFENLRCFTSISYAF